MKTLEDERYVVIKAYKCTVSEIWRDSYVLAYDCVYVVSLHTESTDSVIIQSDSAKSRRFFLPIIHFLITPPFEIACGS